jgi:hypothetical protein
MGSDLSTKKIQNYLWASFRPYMDHGGDLTLFSRLAKYVFNIEEGYRGSSMHLLEKTLEQRI